MTLFWSLFAKFNLAWLSLRYRVRVKGLEKLEPFLRKEGPGILFLPNHPALLDPILLYFFLWPKYRMRPLVVEYVYRLPFIHFFMKIVGAITLPNLESSVNELKIKKAEDALSIVAEGLERGKNFALYPSGRLKHTGKEVLGGSSGVHSLLQQCPDIRIALVRTTGLWGSCFSRAITGQSPDIRNSILQGIKAIFKNGIFFCPRRHVEIEIEVDPPDFPRNESRIECNRYLENWYNRYPGEKGGTLAVEPLKLVSYSFWKKDLPEVASPQKREGVSGNVPISDETRTKIYNELRRILENPGIEISPQKSLSFDLGMDSLNIAEVVFFLDREYDIEELHPEDIETVQNVLEIAAGAKVSEGHRQEAGKYRWPEEQGRPAPSIPQGKTIGEVFLRSCERMDRFSAAGDDLIGVMTYRKMKQSVLVLASHFRKMPDRSIGVLLPASLAAYLVVFALELAGKVPVMLNWTLGPRYLDEMMALSGAKRAISSWRFLDRLSHVEFGSLIDKLELLEEIREELSIATKIKGVLLSLLPASLATRALALDKIREDDPAIVLFTSGSEATPKGVPLSHRNILSNGRAAFQCILIKETDVFYSILPPFHSFGLTLAGMLPVLAGLKVAFYPDPTDGFALAEGVERWKISLFCSAPSFLKGLFLAVKRDEQMQTVRIFVTGAEKASPELFARVEKLGTGAKLIEGYGITECSPCISLNRENLPPKGVGHPLPNGELCTIHPETSELLPPGSEGELCVRGPNVFNGYLGKPRDPFIELEGKRWYRTGDLGYIDKDGALILSGRLKRFTKVGGEMISLGAVEEVLIKELLGRGEISADVPSLAICADERSSDKSQLILFAIFPIEKDEVNEILRKSGFSRIVKISMVKRIEAIPIMGTGKTNYRQLQTLLD